MPYFFAARASSRQNCARLRRQRADQAGEVDDLHAFLPKMRSRSKSLTFSVRPTSPARSLWTRGPRRAVAAVGDVELVAVAPGAALRDLGTLVGHVPAREVVLDDLGDRAPLDEGGEHLDRQAEVGGDARHVGLGAGGLHREGVAAMHRLAVRRRDPDAHARGHDHRPGRVLSQFHDLQFPFREVGARVRTPQQRPVQRVVAGVRRTGGRRRRRRRAGRAPRRAGCGRARPRSDRPPRAPRPAAPRGGGPEHVDGGHQVTGAVQRRRDRGPPRPGRSLRPRR